MEVVGLLPCPQHNARRYEAGIHSDLGAFRVPGIGRELFRDCAEVRSYLLERMWPHWHDMALGLDAQSSLFKDMQAASELSVTNVFTAVSAHEPVLDDGEEPGWQPSVGWVSPVLSWQDWVRLRQELALCSTLCCSELDDLWQELAEESDLLPDNFGEKDTDWEVPLLLEHLLPASESKCPKLRERFGRWLVTNSPQEFVPWWDGALERSGLCVTQSRCGGLG